MPRNPNHGEPVIPSFEHQMIETGDVTLSTHIAGSGPPLILLHGYPQNHMTWAPVAKDFAKHHRCIIPDLRGYGDSSAPEDDADHKTYSKRQMARDIVALMDQLGHETAHVLGHDRGARVAYRLALDHPDRVSKLGIIEIVPTGDFWSRWDAQLALKAYHWTFLAQAAPMPETMIAADPRAYLDWTLKAWTLNKSLEIFTSDALASYRAQMSDPARAHAMCADYRAGATFDRVLDEADRKAGRMITCPVKFLYAETGFPAQTGDPEGLWRDWAPDLQSESCQSGHFVMEENPDAVRNCFEGFFNA